VIFLSLFDSALRYFDWQFNSWESKSAMLGVCSELSRLFEARGVGIFWLPPALRKAGLLPDFLRHLGVDPTDPKLAQREPIFDNLDEDPAPNTRRRVVPFEHNGRKYSIRVYESGPASGPVIVVNAGTITLAAPLMRSLGRTVRVVAYEHAGMGPDAGPLLAADHRRAAGAHPSKRFEALHQAQKSFFRSLDNPSMVDPNLVDTGAAHRVRNLFAAGSEILDQIESGLSRGDLLGALKLPGAAEAKRLESRSKSEESKTNDTLSRSSSSTSSVSASTSMTRKQEYIAKSAIDAVFGVVAGVIASRTGSSDGEQEATPAKVIAAGCTTPADEMECGTARKQF